MSIFKKISSWFERNTEPRTEGEAKSSGGKRLSLHIGINDYPVRNNDLRGCVNDAVRWKKKAQNVYGFDASFMKDSKATRRRVKTAMNKIISGAQENDEILITWSGHGTRTRDVSGDEADGADEAICLYDGIMTDDEIKKVFGKLNPKANLTFISDSCHSGTVTRSFMMSLGEGDDYARARYMPPEEDEDARVIAALPLADSYFERRGPESKMKEVLISGCLPTEYSYDAHLNGKFQGAMSFTALNILDKDPDLTYRELHDKIRAKLPSNRYKQSPQLEGANKKLNRKFLGGPK